MSIKAGVAFGSVWPSVRRAALAAAARQGRDVKQARGEAPQSGPEGVTPKKGVVMTPSSDSKVLLELAERCEAATGPDRELDRAIAPLTGLRLVDEGHPIGRVCYDENNHGVPLPAYTASLDAAMSLVPEGWRIGQLEENWRSGRWHCHLTPRPSAKLIAAFDEGKTIGYDSTEAEAATPALALCAAALKSRSSTTSDLGGEAG